MSVSPTMLLHTWQGRSHTRSFPLVAVSEVPGCLCSELTTAPGHKLSPTEIATKVFSPHPSQTLSFCTCGCSTLPTYSLVLAKGVLHSRLFREIQLGVSFNLQPLLELVSWETSMKFPVRQNKEWLLLASAGDWEHMQDSSHCHFYFYILYHLLNQFQHWAGLRLSPVGCISRFPCGALYHSLKLWGLNNFLPGLQCSCSLLLSKSLWISVFLLSACVASQKKSSQCKYLRTILSVRVKEACTHCLHSSILEKQQQKQQENGFALYFILLLLFFNHLVELPMKSSDPELFFLGGFFFLITNSIFLIVIDLFCYRSILVEPILIVFIFLEIGLFNLGYLIC